MKEQLDRIEKDVLRVEEKVDIINRNGCHHRKNDLGRVEKLEAWKDRGIIGFISLLITLVLSGFYLLLINH